MDRLKVYFGPKPTGNPMDDMSLKEMQESRMTYRQLLAPCNEWRKHGQRELVLEDITDVLFALSKQSKDRCQAA